ncbi:MAG: hypothetical protein QOD42_1190 [Sphingomonadales bacterium]|jgi:hypothetical protein|nr:hypothetical protein [Sphingomonadales bacterium]
MQVFELYDQFTTGWARIRAHITSHLIAAALLWLIGFQLTLPTITTADLQHLAAHPLYGWFQSVGFVALVSFSIAILVALYAIALNAVGNLLLAGYNMLFPPQLGLDDTRRLAPRDALFTIAATLDEGRSEPRDLARHFAELQTAYPISDPEGYRNATVDKSTLKRDSTTQLRNALVFFFAWWLIPLAFPGSGIAHAVKAVFWPGLFALLFYVLMARARLMFALRVTIASLYSTVAAMVLRDESQAARLAAARADPAQVWILVDAFQEEECHSKPSIRLYLRALSGRGAATRDRDAPLGAWYRFGSDEQANRNYRDPAWPVRYLKWRIAALVRAVGDIVRTILTVFGLRAP